MSLWDDEEIDILLEKYPEYAREGRPLHELTEELPDRSVNSIDHKIRDLRDQGKLHNYSDYANSRVDPVLFSGLKRMFWDIETAPNIGFFWQASRKTWISHENIIQEGGIICICYKWEGEDRVHSLTWDNGDDQAMIEEFLDVAAEADEMVAHYGDTFDIKWFNTQCLKYGLQSLPEPKTVDTGVIARRRFRLNSNKLDYISNLLLGRGKNTPPYSTWKRIVLDNDEEALREMLEYCEEDVFLLEDVFQRLSRFHAPKTHAGVMQGLPKWTCAHCASKNVRRKKKRVTARGTPQHSMVCNTCYKHYTISNTAYRDFEGYKSQTS